VLDASRLPDLVRIADGGREMQTRIHDPMLCEGIVGPRRVREPSRRAGGPAPGSEPMPSSEAVVEAASRGVRRVLAVHRALRVPTAIWRDGRLVIVPWQELPELPADLMEEVLRGPRRRRIP
jgi:hypothetical protein